MLYVTMLLALVVLTLGADWLVRGAVRLAERFGVSRLLVALTIVAFGTSAPELAVSVHSTLHGQPDVAVGNVVGSNVMNLLLILGLAALFAPLVIARKLVRIDIPVLVAVSALLLLLSLDGSIGRLDGVLLFAGGVGYTLLSVRLARSDEQVEGEPRPAPRGKAAGDLGWIVAGLVLLVVGARWFVDGAVELARALGVSELVIGLTIVAIGTSLPELATSVVAALRGERDVAVGNVVGSNLLNILAILGLCGLLAPDGVAVSPALVGFDMPVMIAAAFATLPIALARGRIARWEGAFFLLAYAAYALYLVLRATEHDSLPLYSSVMLRFVLPLVAVTLLVLLAQGLQRRRAGAR